MSEPVEIVQPELGARYRVTVSYREPTYEARSGARPNPFRWTYAISAESEEQARASALREFRHTTEMSSVGWSRVVVGVDVDRDDAPAR